MTTYDDDRAEALAFLRHARPTNTAEHLAAAQVNATLALAAATHDAALQEYALQEYTLQEYTQPIALVPVEPQGGAGQPLPDWERELLGTVCGSVLISKERVRQQTVEGYTASHDAAHGARALFAAATCYAILPPAVVVANSTPPTLWPWLPEYWKPKGPLRNLVRAGALAQAAIDADEPGGWYAAPGAELRDVCADRLDVLLEEARQVLYPRPEQCTHEDLACPPGTCDWSGRDGRDG